MSDSIVIIPTYNEKENIEKIIRAVFGLEKKFDILVIDDGSPDGTADIVKKLIADEFADRLHILERSGKLGLGTAYIMGFKWSLKQGYDFIFEMDADFSHDPNDLPRLYAATHDEGYDVAIGSRYVSGVNVVNWPIGRVLMSYFASKYVRFVTGFKVHDTTAGFVCYRRKVLETIKHKLKKKPRFPSGSVAFSYEGMASCHTHAISLFKELLLTSGSVGMARMPYPPILVP